MSEPTRDTIAAAMIARLRTISVANGDSFNINPSDDIVDCQVWDEVDTFAEGQVTFPAFSVAYKAEDNEQVGLSPRHFETNAIFTVLIGAKRGRDNAPKIRTLIADAQRALCRAIPGDVLTECASLVPGQVVVDRTTDKQGVTHAVLVFVATWLNSDLTQDNSLDDE